MHNTEDIGTALALFLSLPMPISGIRPSSPSERFRSLGDGNRTCGSRLFREAPYIGFSGGAVYTRIYTESEDDVYYKPCCRLRKKSGKGRGREGFGLSGERCSAGLANLVL